jgi:hypothetical protein
MVFNCFSCVFSSVSAACFKCFICLQTYVASVASKCFKSRSGVTHVVMHMRSGPYAWSGGAWAARAPHGHVKPRRRQGHAGFLLCERGRRLLVRARETVARASRRGPQVERPGNSGPFLFCASTGVYCWCEREKLQCGHVDAGLGPNVDVPYSDSH